MRRFAAVAALALLTGCAAAPGAGQPTESTVAPSTDVTPSPAQNTAAPDYKACLAATPAGLEDLGPNQSAKAGLDAVGEAKGIQVKAQAATGEDSYASVVDELVADGCDLVTVIGHDDVAKAAAASHSDVNFLLVGEQSNTEQQNLKSLIFDASSATFLAGYLAAAQSTSGVVATFGASQDPDTVVSMNGFVGGVHNYNQVKAASVKVLGWDESTQQGVFLPTPDAGAARTVAEEYTAQGADVIYPVAGQAATGVLDLAKESGGKVAVIWDATDGCEVTDACSVILTSVVDNVSEAVTNAATAAVNGDFDAATSISMIENGGVKLADFHDFDSKVSEETRADIDTILSGMTNGTLEAPAAG